MALPQLPLLSFMAALFLMLLANRVHSHAVTSLQIGSYSFAEQKSKLIFQGDAHIPPNSTFLRLTGTDDRGLPKSWTTGRVLLRHPVQFWDETRQSNFETIIKFLIRSSKKGGADGIAFFIAPDSTTIPRGADGGNLGIFNSSGTNTVFAVEFDTFVNSWDPSYPHIGIDIQSRKSKNTTRFESALGQVVTARINYNSNTHVISVVATAGSQISTLSYVYDLKTILPKYVRVGISSATGWVRDELGVHDILSWDFTSSLVYEKKAPKDSWNNDIHIRQYV